MAFREVNVTESAVRSARSVGLCGDVSKRIARMARRAAPVTHAKGNWRFDDFILNISQGDVLDVYRLAPAEV